MEYAYTGKFELTRRLLAAGAKPNIPDMVSVFAGIGSDCAALCVCSLRLEPQHYTPPHTGATQTS